MIFAPAAGDHPQQVMQVVIAKKKLTVEKGRNIALLEVWAMFSFKEEVRYRNVHGFHILINIVTNRVFRISPKFADLFSQDRPASFSNVYISWLLKHNLENKREVVTEILDHFVVDGLLDHEK